MMECDSTREILGRRSVVLRFGLFLFGLLTSFICSDSIHAYSVSIITNSSISLNVSPSGNGTSIHSESINIISDCRDGYNLTVATPEGSNLYENGDDTKAASFTAVDGVSTLDSSNNTNKWGYTLDFSPSASTIFSPLSTTESILKTTAQTVSDVDINDTFDIYYGVKVDDTIAPGKYQMANNGAVVYYVTMDLKCTQYTIVYDANGGTGSVASQVVQVNENINLNSAASLVAPTGASYVNADNNTVIGDANKMWSFWGWNTEIDGSGDWYKDKEEVADLAQGGETIVLYAQWKQPVLADLVVGTAVGDEKVIDHNTMQDMSPAACVNSAINTSANAPAVTLADYRGKVTTGENPESPELYTVSKLADGLCWMTKNLNLGRNDNGGLNGDGTITLTSDDSDVTSDFVLPVSDTVASTVVATPRIRTTNESGNNNNGVYYSWAAAVAINTSVNAAPATSVCPKNWDLPTRLVFSNLSSKSAYSSSNKTTSAPSSFLATGKFTSGENFSGGSYAFYWTASSSSAAAAYGARVNANGITISATTNTTYGGNKYYEKNIRCVASQGLATFIYSGNGSTSGSVAAQTNVDINSATAKANGFTRTGWAFTGWNTAADGSGIAIAASGSLATHGFLPGSTTTLYAQWTEAYSVQYDGNGADNASDGMGTANATTGLKTVRHTGVGEGFTFDLFASNFKRDGYGFVGWSLDNDAWNKLTDNDATNDPKIWGPNEMFTGPAYSGSSIVTLYAIWAPTETDNGDPVYLQNWTGCSSLTATTYNSSTGALTVAKNTITALTDQRDDMVYAVARLTDGNCWMIENLRLDNSAELTVTNTNISSQSSTLPLINVNNSDSTLVERSNYLSPSSLVAFDASSPTGKYGWCADNTAVCKEQSRLNTDNTTANITPSKTQAVTNVFAHVDFNVKAYSYGNLYNWYSATAGYGTQAKIDLTPTEGDICPTGWALPRGGNSAATGGGNSSGGFYRLASSMSATSSGTANSRRLRLFPNNFIFSGYLDATAPTKITNPGKSARYWASTLVSSDGAARFALETTSFNLATAASLEYHGNSVRCVIVVP